MKKARALRPSADGVLVYEAYNLAKPIMQVLLQIKILLIRR